MEILELDVTDAEIGKMLADAGCEIKYNKKNIDIGVQISLEEFLVMLRKYLVNTPVVHSPVEYCPVE